MTEKLLNRYLKIEPTEHTSFMASDRTSYEEIGRVVAKDDSITDIPLGALVFFDSFMAKKYPVEGTDTFQWFIHYSEVVKYDLQEGV